MKTGTVKSQSDVTETNGESEVDAKETDGEIKDDATAACVQSVRVVKIRKIIVRAVMEIGTVNERTIPWKLGQ